MLGLIGYRAISHYEILQSFADGELWLMDYRFINSFSTENENADRNSNRTQALKNFSVSILVPSMIHKNLTTKYGTVLLRY